MLLVALILMLMPKQNGILQCDALVLNNFYLQTITVDFFNCFYLFKFNLIKTKIMQKHNLNKTIFLPSLFQFIVLLFKFSFYFFMTVAAYYFIKLFIYIYIYNFQNSFIKYLANLAILYLFYSIIFSFPCHRKKNNIIKL